MSNTLITPTIVAKEAIMRLKNNLVLGNLVYRNYSDEFVKGVGDTIKIKAPAVFEAKEYNGTIFCSHIKRIDLRYFGFRTTVY